MPQKATPIPVRVRGKGSANTGAAARIRRIKLDNPELGADRIARLAGCSSSNVTRVLQRFLGKQSEDDFRAYQSGKADLFDALQFRIHESISDADIAKAPLLPRVTAAAILEDKARVIRGQATQINVTMLLDAVQTIRELRKVDNETRTIDADPPTDS